MPLELPDFRPRGSRKAKLRAALLVVGAEDGTSLDLAEFNPGDALLLEGGDYVLLESGDEILLEG